MQESPCKKYKLTGSFNLKFWHTMSLWETDDEINNFYRNGIHLEAMKKSKTFFSKIQSKRITVENNELGNWRELKKIFTL
nr:DUF3291 domain-containing protein [Halpernia frigidisoli]